MLDATVVNVALPALGRELDADLAGLQWTVNAYTLTLAGFILLGGSLGDRYGRRRVFLVGVVWFGAASVLCGLAPNVPLLVAARALQGVGGALLTPGSLAIIQASFAREDRPGAVGAWSGLGGVAAAAGPFAGGWLVDAAGWRWVFLLNVPLVALVVLVTVRHVPESSDPGARGRFDVPGAALAALALAGTTYALTEAPGGRTAPVVAAAGLGLAAAAGFVLVERAFGRGRRPPYGGPAPAPMLPPGMFASRRFSAVNGVTFLMYGAMGVLFFLLVLDLQIAGGFSPLAAGAALLPITASMLLLSARAGALAQRTGPRLPMTAGLVVAAGGTLLLARIGASPSYWRDVLPAVTVFGLGLSAVVAPLTATVLAAADERHAGVASGVNNAVARAAGLLAVAAVPPLTGLTGGALADPARFARGFGAAMAVCAALLLAAALLSLLTIAGDVLRTPTGTLPAPAARRHCAVAAPPLEPGPGPPDGPKGDENRG